jgi:hypothetical protein
MEHSLTLLFCPLRATLARSSVNQRGKPAPAPSMSIVIDPKIDLSY